MSHSRTVCTPYNTIAKVYLPLWDKKVVYHNICIPRTDVTDEAASSVSKLSSSGSFSSITFCSGWTLRKYPIDEKVSPKNCEVHWYQPTSWILTFSSTKTGPLWLRDFSFRNHPVALTKGLELISQPATIKQKESLDKRVILRPLKVW